MEFLWPILICILKCKACHANPLLGADCMHNRFCPHLLTIASSTKLPHSYFHCIHCEQHEAEQTFTAGTAFISGFMGCSKGILLVQKCYSLCISSQSLNKLAS